MPEDLEDKLIDFEMMLEGFVLSDETAPEEVKSRLLSYWDSMSNDINKRLGEK